MLTDEALLAEYAGGSIAALEALVYRYHSPIFGYIYRLTQNRALSEDLTQETFLRFMKSINSGNLPELLRPWLYTIATNLVRDNWRKAANRQETPATEILSERADETDWFERLVDRREVAAAVARLEPVLREVVTLRFFEDLKIREIALITGVVEGTVKSRLFRALYYLREFLSESKEEYSCRVTR